LRRERARRPPEERADLAVAALGAVMALSGGCATVTGGARDLPPRECARGLTASFVQLSERELGFDRAAWREEVALLRSMGARTLVVQFSGDDEGPYDRRRPGRTPVRDLLDEAGAAGLTTWLGLHADRHWPDDRDLARNPPAPLDDAAASAELVGLCRARPTCEGFYLSTEVDDHLGLDAAPRVSSFLASVASALRRLAPDKRLAVAPFFTGVLAPREHAAFWQPFLATGLVDVFMLQDGVGTRRATPSIARDYLAALRAVMPRGTAGPRGSLELWSVVELFDQLAGPPRDARPFTARPASFRVIARSLALEGAVADRLIAFSMLDYGDPRRSRRAARLYKAYTDWCDEQRAQPPSEAASAPTKTAER
jgi:hypothetical protein